MRGGEKWMGPSKGNEFNYKDMFKLFSKNIHFLPSLCAKSFLKGEVILEGRPMIRERRVREERKRESRSHFPWRKGMAKLSKLEKPDSFVEYVLNSYKFMCISRIHVKQNTNWWDKNHNDDQGSWHQLLFYIFLLTFILETKIPAWRVSRNEKVAAPGLWGGSAGPTLRYSPKDNFVGQEKFPLITVIWTVHFL